MRVGSIASELSIDEKAIRVFLRSKYGNLRDGQWCRRYWDLTPEQAESVRLHFKDGGPRASSGRTRRDAWPSIIPKELRKCIKLTQAGLLEKEVLGLVSAPNYITIETREGSRFDFISVIRNFHPGGLTVRMGRGRGKWSSTLFSDGTFYSHSENQPTSFHNVPRYYVEAQYLFLKVGDGDYSYHHRDYVGRLLEVSPIPERLVDLLVKS